jgi:UDPglucose--hexose-1-phosphate uridylyltransferase
MTTVRHRLTGDAVLYAPARSERPHAFTGEGTTEERCPFCPGHEADTPPEIARWGGPWQIRVVPNKYPPAAGAEVIVESADHGARFEEIACREEILHAYRSRLLAHADAPWVALFRNDGPRAGASLPHVHAQLVPLPFVPPRAVKELSNFAEREHCPLCHVEGTVLRQSEFFTWFTPAASWMPYQQWIVPRRHVHALTELDERELADLASLLGLAAKATRLVGDANWLFMNFPHGTKAHFYVEVLPRVTTIAGLELGTGTFVEIVDPATAAKRLG